MLNYLVFSVDQGACLLLYWHPRTWLDTWTISCVQYRGYNTTNRVQSSLHQAFCLCCGIWGKLFSAYDVWIFTAKAYFSLCFCREKNCFSYNYITACFQSLCFTVHKSGSVYLFPLIKRVSPLCLQGMLECHNLSPECGLWELPFVPLDLLQDKAEESWGIPKLHEGVAEPASSSITFVCHPEASRRTCHTPPVPSKRGTCWAHTASHQEEFPLCRGSLTEPSSLHSS